PSLILLHGLYLALLYKNTEAFDIYINEMDAGLRNIILKLMGGHTLPAGELNDIRSYFDDDNSDLFFYLCEFYVEKATAFDLMTALEERFSGDAKYLITMGNLYSQEEKFEKAEFFYRKALTLKSSDPSSVFYLISILVHQNKPNEIKELIAYASSKYGHIPVVSQKLEILKEKLQEVLK
ncbi:MAG: tetratricopeptide repeat protein, partial [Syntrophothermus sp.]